jgi:hypothetical protein
MPTAEILSLSEGCDGDTWLRKVWFELSGQWLDINLVVDSMGIANSIANTKMHAERLLRIDFALVPQGLRRGEFILTWVPSVRALV